MANDDLLEHAKSDVDFYALLGVAFETSTSDIRRAYRKTALKYHPDKRGKDFDPEQFHLLQIANDVLSDPGAKAVYDNIRNAKLQKQRANELFEGKRKQMKDELEARERNGVSSGTPTMGGMTGMKRDREDDEMGAEIKRLAEEGKRRRKEMEEKIRVSGGSAPVTPRPATPKPTEQPRSTPQHARTVQTAAEEEAEEDEVARLERRIREAQKAKAQRKAEKHSRKSGRFVPADLSAATPDSKWEREETKTSTPIKRPDLFNGLKADENVSASPKFSFSPTAPKSRPDEFAATMERLKAAEKKRLEEEIRRKEAAETAQ